MNEDFQMIYTKYRNEIYLFILKLVGYQKDIAEELAQETFYQTFLSLYRYRGECDIKSWICQIAKNTCYTYMRKNPIHNSIDEDNFEESQVINVCKGIEENLLDKELMGVINKALNRLKPKYKDVLIYRLFLELHFSEIGRIMKITENSAKVIYFRGKSLLIKELEELQYGR